VDFREIRREKRESRKHEEKLKFEKQTLGLHRSVENKEAQANPRERYACTIFLPSVNP
jgi:hypothetical protein